MFNTIVNPNLSDRSQLLITRLACVVSALIAMAIALPNFTTIDNLVKYAWSGLGATFGPLVIATLYFSHIKPSSSWLGMAVGGGIVVLSPFLGFANYSLVIAFPAALTAIYLTSNPNPFRLRKEEEI